MMNIYGAVEEQKKEIHTHTHLYIYIKIETQNHMHVYGCLAFSAQEFHREKKRGNEMRKGLVKEGDPSPIYLSK